MCLDFTISTSLRNGQTKEQKFAEPQCQGGQADKRLVQAQLKKDNDSKTCLELYPWNGCRGKKGMKRGGFYGGGDRCFRLFQGSMITKDLSKICDS